MTGKKATMRAVVGANVEKARRDMGLSQQALGGRLEQWLGVPWSRQAVSLAELGKRAFGVDDLVGLSVGLRVSVVELLTPDPEVETIVLESGMEFPTSFFEHEVVGVKGAGQEAQRSRYAGRMEELDTMSKFINERAENLIERVKELGLATEPAPGNRGADQ